MPHCLLKSCLIKNLKVRLYTKVVTIQLNKCSSHSIIGLGRTRGESHFNKGMLYNKSKAITVRKMFNVQYYTLWSNFKLKCLNSILNSLKRKLFMMPAWFWKSRSAKTIFYCGEAETLQTKNWYLDIHVTVLQQRNENVTAWGCLRDNMQSVNIFPSTFEQWGPWTQKRPKFRHWAACSIFKTSCFMENASLYTLLILSAACLFFPLCHDWNWH